MKRKTIAAFLLCLSAGLALTACGTTTASSEEGTETENQEVYDDTWDGTYTGEETITSDQEIDSESYSFTDTNKNGLVIDGATVQYSTLNATKTSSATRIKEASYRYGLGATIFARDSFVNIMEGGITSDAAGATGIFAYTAAETDASNMTISTSGVYSAGGACSAGGTLVLDTCTVSTEGRESAGVKGIGDDSYINIQGTSIETKGKNSPGIHAGCEASITSDEIVAYASEALRVEAPYSVWVSETNLTGNRSGLNPNDFNWVILAYDSDEDYDSYAVSSDEADESDETTSGEFYLSNCTVTSHSGGMFYVTNTETTIYLENTEFVYSGAEDDYFLRVQGNNDMWGKVGENGAKCTFNVSLENATGDVYYDSISELDFLLENNSTFTGAINKDDSFAGDGGDGYCRVGVQDESSWIVTGDSVVDIIECSGQILDEEGNTVSIVGTDGTVYVEGDSEYTVTTGSYSDSFEV